MSNHQIHEIRVGDLLAITRGMFTVSLSKIAPTKICLKTLTNSTNENHPKIPEKEKNLTETGAARDFHQAEGLDSATPLDLARTTACDVGCGTECLHIQLDAEMNK